MKMQNDLFGNEEMTQVRFLREKKLRLHQELQATSEELETLLKPEDSVPLTRNGDVILKRVGGRNFAIVERHTYHVGPPVKGDKHSHSEILCFVDIESLYNAVMHFAKRTDS
jgi:hypothetical protein